MADKPGIVTYLMNKNSARWRYMRQRELIEDFKEQLIGCEWWASQCKRRGAKGLKRRQEAIKLEAVQLVLRAMRGFEQNEVVFAAGCRALSSMCLGEECAEIVRLDGGKKLIETGIIFFKDDAFVVQDGTDALAALKMSGTSRALKQIEAAEQDLGAELRGIAGVMEMLDHDHMEEVQMAGVQTLRRLLAGELNKPSDRIEAREVNLCHILGRIGELHFEDNDLMLETLRIVQTLAQDPMNSGDLGKMGSVDQAVRVLNEKLFAPYLPQQALWTLGALAVENDSNQDRMRKLELLQLIDKIKMEHSDEGVAASNKKKKKRAAKAQGKKSRLQLVAEEKKGDGKPKIVFAEDKKERFHFPLSLNRMLLLRDRLKKDIVARRELGEIIEIDEYGQALDTEEEKKRRMAASWTPCLYAQTLGKGTCYVHCKDCHILNKNKKDRLKEHYRPEFDVEFCERHSKPEEEKIEMDEEMASNIKKRGFVM